ncbi:hypothetical protein SAMN05444169_8540 [Bradyrhizobium erythrophlei]|jgi:hypothetical protein|uniref:Uncharacterized protein n=1 Tax=Bradyrhizobium erythrophlei TaxID=1437360 RepID=A0A1M5UNN1_9BRAD|nr:hypothetical protein SAMN05444169_8540 [Bradyrhizobium erythrophlei]
MHIHFDISPTGLSKVGWRYLREAVINTMIAVTRQNVRLKLRVSFDVQR